MGAYKLTPCSISDSSDDSIPIVEARIFNLYQNMMAAEKEEEEKTLLDLLNKVEEERYETQLSDNIFVHNANKLEESTTKPTKKFCPYCGDLYYHHCECMQPEYEGDET